MLQSQLRMILSPILDKLSSKLLWIFDCCAINLSILISRYKQFEFTLWASFEKRSETDSKSTQETNVSSRYERQHQFKSCVRNEIKHSSLQTRRLNHIIAIFFIDSHVRTKRKSNLSIWIVRLIGRYFWNNKKDVLEKTGADPCVRSHVTALLLKNDVIVA